RFDCDWSSDVCSSDLSIHGKLLADLFDQTAQIAGIINTRVEEIKTSIRCVPKRQARLVQRTVGMAVEKSSRLRQRADLPCAFLRSEERRVGKECRTRR